MTIVPERFSFLWLFLQLFGSINDVDSIFFFTFRSTLIFIKQNKNRIFTFCGAALWGFSCTLFLIFRHFRCWLLTSLPGKEWEPRSTANLLISHFNILPSKKFQLYNLKHRCNFPIVDNCGSFAFWLTVCVTFVSESIQLRYYYLT